MHNCAKKRWQKSSKKILQTKKGPKKFQKEFKHAKKVQKYERRRKVPQNCFKKWAKKLLKHFPKNKEKKLQKAREKNSIIGPKSTTTKSA